jgi:hypothetical protein
MYAHLQCLLCMKSDSMSLKGILLSAVAGIFYWVSMEKYSPINSKSKSSVEECFPLIWLCALIRISNTDRKHTIYHYGPNSFRNSIYTDKLHVIVTQTKQERTIDPKKIRMPLLNKSKKAIHFAPGKCACECSRYLRDAMLASLNG